jgi:hypothetical protein
MVVAVTQFDHDVIRLTEKSVVEFFSRYNSGFEAFFYFCKDEFVYRAPNASTIRFNYCPMTGQKINWKEIYETNKQKFRDYDSKLDKTFYNN